MKKLLSLLTAALLLPLVLGAQTLAPNQLLLGHYTTDDITTGTGWGMSMLNGVKPIATDLTPEELAFFQGSKIVSFRIGLAQSTAVSRVFVIPIDANGNLGDVTEWPCDVSSEGWNVVTLDAPYLINLPADYSLRIGFDYDQTRTNKPISAVKVGTVYPTYHFHNGVWKNYGVNTHGNLSLQLICENDNFPAFVIMMRNLTAKASLKQGDDLQFKFQVRNLGTMAVESGQCAFDVAVDGVTVATITNSMPINATYTDMTNTIPTDNIEAGQHTLTVTAVSVNGENLENPPYLTTTFTVFDQGFTRQMRLLEQLTSTYCTYCPLGNSMLQHLMNLRDDIAWVGIHGNLGTGVDPFRSNQGDSIMSYLAGNSVSYPSGAFDRRQGFDSEDANSVVPGLGYYEQYHAQAAQMFSDLLDAIPEEPAYAEVNINSTYDAATRKAVITVEGDLVDNFYELMGTDCKLTVYITEDHLIASQLNSGTWVNDYEHNGVFRQALVSAKGVNPKKDGNHYTNEFTVNIPTSWNADNLNIVAFISRPLRANAFADIYVTNANKRKLGEFDEPTAERGDANGDGVVNITDVTALIDFLLSGVPVDEDAADCNLDGAINITDVTALIDYLLGGNW